LFLSRLSTKKIDRNSPEFCRKKEASLLNILASYQEACLLLPSPCSNKALGPAFSIVAT